jgi:hypothetical protein
MDDSPMVIVGDVQVIINETDKVSCPQSFFFTGCAFGVSFYVGVFRAMVDRWGYDEISKAKMGGNSSGAAMALAIALGTSVEECNQLIIVLLTSARNDGIFGKITTHQTCMLDRLLVVGDEYEKLNGKLFVGVTVFYCKHVLISEWSSNQELIDTLHAGWHIPFYCQYVKKLKMGIAMDGGFSSTYSHITENTLIVNATTSQGGDINCEPKLTMFECIFPVCCERSEIISNRGYSAMWQWDGVFKNVKDKRIVPKVVLCSFWVGRWFEEVSSPVVVSCGVGALLCATYCSSSLVCFSRRR